jgi:phosphatidylinositol phospholipase C, delta
MASPQFDPPLLSHLRTIFDRYAAARQTWSQEQAEVFFRHIQEDEHKQVPEGGLDFDAFVHYMTSPAAEALGPAPPVDLSWPLNNYFVSSSHNSYLVGNQLTSDSSTEAYREILLRGGRCVEIDVWDGTERFTDAINDTDAVYADEESRQAADPPGLGEGPGGKVGFRMRTMMKLGGWVAENFANEKGKRDMAEIQGNWGRLTAKEPRVLHGHTLTKEISFREVCRTIKEHAFQTSELPVVVSLEVHCSPEQQEKMVQIMEETWGDHLLPPVELEAMDRTPPSPAALHHKILVKVKYIPPRQGSSDDVPGDDAQDDTDEGLDGIKPAEGAPANEARPPKIIALLSRLGIFTRGVSFRAMEQAEAEMPHHIFSLSEGMVDSTHQHAAGKFFAHNRRFLMRSYPAGSRVDSSNFDPAAHWRKGIQFAALNWQTWDRGTMLNDAMFDGSNGYVLKPAGYRDAPHLHEPALASDRVLRHLSIRVLGVQGLPLPAGVHDAHALRPYLTVELSAEKHPLAQADTKLEPLLRRTATKEGACPSFDDEHITFDYVDGVAPELSFVLFQICHDLGSLVASACIRLDRLRTGYRLVRLRNSLGEATDAVMLVKIDKKMM